MTTTGKRCISALDSPHVFRARTLELRVAHSEVVHAEVTPDPNGDGINVLVHAHGGVRIEHHFPLRLAIGVRDGAQQALAIAGRIRGASARMRTTQNTPRSDERGYKKGRQCRR